MKVALLMPFILNSDESKQSIADEENAHSILKCINVSFVSYSVACIAANEIFRFNDLDKTVGKLRLFDILPYLTLVMVLLYSICKIKLMVKDQRSKLRHKGHWAAPTKGKRQHPQRAMGSCHKGQ